MNQRRSYVRRRPCAFVAALSMLSLAACSSSAGGFTDPDAGASSNRSASEDDASGAAPVTPNRDASITLGAGALSPEGGRPSASAGGCSSQGATRSCDPSGSGDASAVVAAAPDGGCNQGTQTCNSSGEFLTWSLCVACPVPVVTCRDVSVSFTMTQDNYDSPTLNGNELIVSVTSTGGGWCACGGNGADDCDGSGLVCPMACPSGVIGGGGTSMSVAGYDEPGYYWDNDGECSYSIEICGSSG